jgi:subtilisin
MISSLFPSESGGFLRTAQHTEFGRWTLKRWNNRGTNMAKQPVGQQYILLPPRGLSPIAAGAAPAASRFLVEMSARGPEVKKPFKEIPLTSSHVRMIDEIREHGAKLIQASPEGLLEIRMKAPGVRIVPVVIFHMLVVPRMTVSSRPKSAGAQVATKITLQVVSKAGKGVPGAMVVAFTDFENRIGAQGRTNASGKVSLALGAASRRLQRLYVYPDSGFWGALKKNVTVKNGSHVTLSPLDVAFDDCVRHFYGRAGDDAGAGVTVGVIDSGVDTNHPDLTVQGGMNTVVDENPNDYGDNGGHHGTHVGGIIAAHGSLPKGLRGVAPGATLRSYRVFGKDSDEATNYSIAKAIDNAVSDGCDLINMSLGGGAPDDATRSAIADARSRGTLVIVAAGNDSRQSVSFPASDPRSIAVSALGRKSALPRTAVEQGDVQFPPTGSDKQNFIAGFSNVGPEIALTGPGVGVISTVPGGYAIMSGTSMACPAVTGAAARLLSKPANASILKMPRSQDRSDAMAQALLKSAKLLGFGSIYEGRGLPQ